MLRPIMEQMAALAKTSQASQPVVGRVVMEVGSGEDNAGLPYARGLLYAGVA
jgi:hypothetical protein